MRIIGIDPGYERLGVAIVEKTAREKERVVFSECFKTSAKLPHVKRLLLLGEEVARVIAEYKPEAIGIETLFFNSNQKTAMSVAEARGVILYEAVRAGLKIFEYTPLQIKIAVTGYGRADKNQVYEMVNKLAVVPNSKMQDDEFDAIAVALTCFAHNR